MKGIKIMKCLLLVLMFLHNNVSFAMEKQTKGLSADLNIKEQVKSVKRKKRCSLKDTLYASAIFAGGFVFHSLISPSCKNQPDDSYKNEQRSRMERYGNPCRAVGEYGLPDLPDAFM